MPLRIAFVLFPGFQQLDLAGPLAVFEVAERYRLGSYTWRFVAATPGPVASTAGLAWMAQPLPRRGSFDMLMVSGGDAADAASADPALLRWLRRAGEGGVRVTSVCSGSLLLAAAGLLEGKAATTHWSRSAQVQRHHPQVRWRPDRIWVRDGDCWTSAGITAGIDLALALVAHDLGEAVAKAVARQLVVAQRRLGGQSQFSALLELQQPEGRFAALLDGLRARLTERLAVEDLAAECCMSPRHFARAFKAETGVTPARAVERLRVEAARAQLESGAHAIAQVARACGFGSVERMRRALLRITGQPPARHRRSSARSAP